jgi:hypothetical protein
MNKPVIKFLSCIVVVLGVSIIPIQILANKSIARNSERENLTFKAWSKHTGNTNSLTFEEWKLLKDMRILAPSQHK